tara:strand:+ start:1630 stop:2304 length:675 start_codon:yes stop_codon:yes gene_type:complete
MSARLNRKQIAWRVAQDIPEGAYVNLGIGAPEMVANYLPGNREVIIHSENGLLGMGRTPPIGEENPDLINAGKKPVTLVDGGSIFHHTDSFAMIRGGHLDICVLGAFQVSQSGDLANWATLDNSRPPGVGGAMDLAVGAKEIFIITDHCTKDGQPKLLEQCTYPLTGNGVVTRIYTDHALIDVKNNSFLVREIIDGTSLDELQKITGGRLVIENHCSILNAPDL